jgi:hypothetical protein
MSTKYSEIRSWFAGKTNQERMDATKPGRFITRLGDVKVDTKTPGGDGPVDVELTMERYQN